jgi:hypothetical protein
MSPIVDAARKLVRRKMNPVTNNRMTGTIRVAVSSVFM